MDVDPNYDPSDFLMHGLPKREDQAHGSGKVQDDLVVSESDNENHNNEIVKLEDHDADDGSLWF